MIPSNIERKHILSAISEIITNGVPSHRKSSKFALIYDGEKLPPKYVVSLANRFVNGYVLAPELFNGGKETNRFLSRMGFQITMSGSGKKSHETKEAKTSVSGESRNKHNERCPACKRAVELLLRSIYGIVRKNHDLKTPARIDNYEAFPFRAEATKIFAQLQTYRGHRDFVKTPALPRCDFFVPNPGFIVEFDESQHFSILRKISLQNYPTNLELGFDREKWIALCDQIKAKDNRPLYRDEQRAWYDTLRDLLPEHLGLMPTVRLFSKDMKWCDLDPGSEDDIHRFKRVLESNLTSSDTQIATVLLQSSGNHSNSERLHVLNSVIKKLSKEMKGSGIILFPGGWFKAGKRKAESLYDWAEKEVSNILRKEDENKVVCLGIDGSVSGEHSKDQIAIAISSKGIEALGRKFYPAPNEKGHIALANGIGETENGRSRVFQFNGRKYFLAACYDSFGIRKLAMPNPGVHAVLDLVHGFRPPGGEGSGNFYFARDGFARASKQWACPVFGAAVFFDRKIPKNWPSGVLSVNMKINLMGWKYDGNPLKPLKQFELDNSEGKARVRIFSMYQSGIS